MASVFRLNIMLFFLFTITVPSWANARLIIDEHTDARVPLGNHTLFLEDKLNSLNIDQVINKESQLEWLQGDKDLLGFGYTGSSYWFKIIIENRSNITAAKYLEVAYSLLDSVLVYESQNGKIVQTYQMGAALPYNQRPLKYRNFVVPVEILPSQSATFYIRTQTETSMQTPMILWDRTIFAESGLSESILLGLFYGSMAIMICYNLFILLVTRIVSYAYYIGYVLSIVVFSACINGHFFQYLWPNSLPWYDSIQRISIFTGIVSVMLFTNSFLELSRYSPRCSRLTHLMAIATTLAFFAGSFFTYRYGVVSMILMMFLGVVVGFGVSFYRLLKGSRPAKFFVVGWSCVLAGAAIFGLGKLNIIPGSHFTEYAFQTASVIEVLLLSLALGDRFNQERSEKEKAQVETAKMEIASRAKTQFFATMSHEFRTPLTAILGYSEMADQEGTNDKKKREYIKTIRYSAEHMLQLINDILDISKIEAQKMEIESAATPLVDLLEDVSAFMWVLAEQKEIDFRLTYEYPIPKVISTDPTRLKQALINLCSNAIKFTHKGGVTLNVRFVEKSKQLELAVIDTGIGLKPEQLKILFSAFTQAEKSTSRSYGGTGLGLFLSKQIANRLGGDIAVTSEYGKGSTFTISIDPGPLDDIDWIEASQNHEEPSNHDSVVKVVPEENKEAHPEKHSIKVMLAEDNKVNQQLMAHHLNKLGAQVYVASDGMEAIASAIRDEVDLVFMDMDMPFIEGMKAVKLMRERGFDKPIYALTGNTGQQAEEETRNAGCQGHLTKPIKMDELSKILKLARSS